MIKYKNCEITELENIIKGLSGTNRKIYEIKHILGYNTLHAISLAEAYQMATLLNLEYLVSDALEPLEIQ
jgi:hypothetical protein